MHRLIGLLFAACASAPRAPAPTPPVPVDATLAEPLPETEAPVGAVQIPGEGPVEEVSIHHLDRTVRVADLPAPTATWSQRKTVAYRGRVALALHIATHTDLELTVVDTVTETETGYPGALEGFRLGGADTHEQPASGNAFPPRDVDPTTVEYVGPVMFAVRLLPRTGAPEAERRQYVVYTHDRSVFVADKLVTEARWIARLRIDLPNATQLVAMNPGWH
jgi:hypothetical protein